MENPFFKNNNSLTDIEVTCCEFGADSARMLSFMLGGRKNKSLKHVALQYNEMGEGQLVDVIFEHAEA